MASFLTKAKTSILRKSGNVEYLKEPVKGYDWKKGVNFSEILDTYQTTGFQATNFGRAVTEMNKMIECRQHPFKIGENEVNEIEFKDDPFLQIRNNCTIFLGYTSNIVSSGLRETIRFLVQHKMIDVIVTSAGGIEEDFIKCLGPTYVADFNLDGKKLRSEGINRIGNLVVPNNNYRKFEDFIMPVLDEMVEEQNKNGMIWTPSKMITRLGEKIGDEDSIYYWAAKNKIPVFSPAITDGSIGDMLFFHSYNKKNGIMLDIVSDIRRINCLTMKAHNTGAVIIGGGLAKHHILNTNSMRDGANYTVYLNTGSEFDGSDAGARPDEAFTWGKINLNSDPVKIFAEASLVFPLLVGKTFAKNFVPMKNGI